MLELVGIEIRDTLAEIVDPKSTALLVWDMEYAIAPNAFNFKDIVANLKSLATVAREIGVPVLYSKQAHFDLAKGEEAGPFIRIRMKRAKITDPAQLLKQKHDPRGQEIVEGLEPEPQDVVFQKRRPDGFIGTDLDLLLRTKSIRTIVIGGVSTEGGVEGTARTGRNLGYDMVVLRDSVGSRNREVHELALKVMEGSYFHVATSGEVAEIWRRSKK